MASLERSASDGSYSGRSSSESGSRSSSSSNGGVSTAAAEDEIEEEDFVVPIEDRPPEYTSVLLEAHLAQSSRFEGLYPPDLVDAIKSHLLFPAGPPPHPHRTWHTRVRNFDEGAGTYYGELDPKSRRNGYGHVVYEGEGNRYQGSWKKGLMEGTGSYLWAATGSCYQGAWRRGERNGKGCFVFGPLKARRGIPLAVCTGVWVNGKVRKGTEVVRFVNGDGGVEVAPVEEADCDGGGEASGSSSSSGGESETENSGNTKTKRLIKRIFKSVVKR